MNPFFVTDFSISDSLKTVRKSVLIYETIIHRRNSGSAIPEGWLSKSGQVAQKEPEYSTVGQTTHTHFAKVIPPELSDMLIAEGKKINKSKQKKE